MPRVESFRFGRCGIGKPFVSASLLDGTGGKARNNGGAKKLKKNREVHQVTNLIGRVEGS